MSRSTAFALRQVVEHGRSHLVAAAAILDAQVTDGGGEHPALTRLAAWRDGWVAAAAGVTVSGPDVATEVEAAVRQAIRNGAAGDLADRVDESWAWLWGASDPGCVGGLDGRIGTVADGLVGRDAAWEVKADAGRTDYEQGGSPMFQVAAAADAILNPTGRHALDEARARARFARAHQLELEARQAGRLLLWQALDVSTSSLSAEIARNVGREETPIGVMGEVSLALGRWADSAREGLAPLAGGITL